MTMNDLDPVKKTNGENSAHKSFSVFLIYLAGIIALIGVVIHIAAIIGGINWYVYFGAPPIVVQSAREGTWLAPVSALVIASLMLVCAAYAFSALGLLRRLPFLRIGLAGMAGVCLLRSFILWPLMINHPELRNTFEIVAALVWGLAGFGFMFGYRLARSTRG